MPNAQPIHQERSWKSLWQGYAIYPDHLELTLMFLYRMRIPFKDLEGVEVRPRWVFMDFFRGNIPASQGLRVLKSDLADLFQHVSVRKKAGWWRQIRITPQNPTKFCEKVNRAMSTKNR